MSTRTVYDSLINTFQSESDIIGIALGGSRSRGTATKNSDYDLFIVIRDECYLHFFENIGRTVEQNIQEIICFAEDRYLEDWGHMFRAIDYNLTFYDIAFIPKSRIQEMKLRSDNLAIFDPFKVIEDAKEKSKNIDYKDRSFLESKEATSRKMFYINYAKFLRGVNKEDYWLAFRFLNRMRENYFTCYRIKNFVPANLYHIPDQNFELDTKLYRAKESFKLDGTIKMLLNNSDYLLSSYLILYPESEMILDAIRNLYETRYE